MKLKSTGDLVCTCDDQHTLHLTHSVRKDVVGWDVLTSPSNNVSDIRMYIGIQKSKSTCAIFSIRHDECFIIRSTIVWKLQA